MNRLIVLLGIFSVFLFTAVSAFAFDHTYHTWDQFLKQYVRSGLVDYSAIKRSPEGFKETVDQFENLTVREYTLWTTNEKKAFWINAYNVGAMKLILDNYPLKKSFGLSALRYPANSIQQIPDVWNQPVLNLLGEEVSLNHIENEVLRKEFEDPRVHFAIVCASIGCPVIREEAYSSGQLDAQLNDQVVQFVNTPAKFRYDAGRDILFLSPILKWFKGDFDKEEGRISFLKSYMPADTASKLENNTRIEWLEYDWSLNDQK